MTRTYNILYKGRKVYSGLSPEESTEVLTEFAEKYYTDDDFDLNELELEEILK